MLFNYTITELNEYMELINSQVDDGKKSKKKKQTVSLDEFMGGQTLVRG